MSANLSSSQALISLSVKNNGTANLVGLGFPSVTPGGGDYCFTTTWNPMPAATYPVYPGESVKGYCELQGSAYRPGLQVTVSVSAAFSDRSTSVLSAAVKVTP